MLRLPLARLARSTTVPTTTFRAFSTTRTTYKHVLEAGPEQLRAALLPDNDRLTLIQFTASWCGPCRQLGPALKAAVPEDSSTTDLLVIDTDTHQELAASFKIAALPTVLAVRAGKPVSKFVGGLSPPQIKEFLDKCNE